MLKYFYVCFPVPRKSPAKSKKSLSIIGKGLQTFIKTHEYSTHLSSDIASPIPTQKSPVFLSFWITCIVKSD